MRATFLEELARRGIVSDAAKAAGVDRSTPYRWRDAEPDFAAAWDEAVEHAIETMEREAYRRAVEGVEEPLIGRVGKDEDGIITYVKRYSDSLLTTLLKAHKPEKYRERTDVHHSGAISVEFVNDWRTSDA